MVTLFLLNTFKMAVQPAVNTPLFPTTGVCDSADKSESRSDTTEIISDKKSTVIREHHYYGPYPYYPTERPVYVRYTRLLSEV